MSWKKVFHFPDEEFSSEWIVVTSDRRFNSWGHYNEKSITELSRREEIIISKIDDFLRYPFGRLAEECFNGLRDAWCVWDSRTGEAAEPTRHNSLLEIQEIVQKINELDIWAEPMYHEVEEYIDQIEKVLERELK